MKEEQTMPKKSKSQIPMNMAVIGVGFGQFHIRGILNDPARFHLSMICDQDVERINKEMLNRLKIPSTCRIVSDYHATLSDSAIHAVVVSLPHHLHEQACVEAARAGKHIIVDKPIARTLAEADHIIQEAAKNKVTLMVAYNQRFSPMYQKIRELVSSGAIGQPVYAITRHNQNFNPPAGANWRSKTSVGGGCVMGSGVHNLDLMRWFFGEPQEVFAYGTRDPQRLEAEVAASISFRYRSGLVVNFSCNWGAHGALNGFEWGEWAVFGARGDIAMRNETLQVGREFGKTTESITPDASACETLWVHFANSISNGTKPLTNGLDARASLSLVLKIYESMEKGCPVAC